jgi:hypothetical protein
MFLCENESGILIDFDIHFRTQLDIKLNFHLSRVAVK